MSDRATETHGLDALLDLARQTRAEPSPALLGRVYADATAELDLHDPQAVALPHRKKKPVAALVAAVGGWPAMVGMATATVAGVWIGISPPDGLVNLGGGYFYSETDLYFTELMPTLDGFLEEEQ